jgi:hypothetical protein
VLESPTNLGELKLDLESPPVRGSLHAELLAQQLLEIE